jgi:hypothetical protein
MKSEILAPIVVATATLAATAKTIVAEISNTEWPHLSWYLVRG